MIKRDPVLPPDFLYPIEEWRWGGRGLPPPFLPPAETIFAVANGYLRVRGAFEEGGPAPPHGTLLNRFHEKHVAAISYRVTVLNARAALVLVSEFVNPVPVREGGEDDPRLARGLSEGVLAPQRTEGADRRILLSYLTRNSGMGLACGMDHTLETECSASFKSNWGEDGARVVFHLDAEPGKPITLAKYLTYHTS